MIFPPRQHHARNSGRTNRRPRRPWGARPSLGRPSSDRQQRRSQSVGSPTHRFRGGGGGGLPGSEQPSSPDSSDTHPSYLSRLLREFRDRNRDRSRPIDTVDSDSDDVPDPNEKLWAELDLLGAAPWFVARNMHTAAQLQEEVPKVALYRKASALNAIPTAVVGGGGGAGGEGRGRAVPYQLHEKIFDELSTIAAAGLRSSIPSEGRIVICCPADNGHFFVEAVVHMLARRLGADLVCFGLQDLADLKELAQLERRRELLEALPYVCGGSAASKRDEAKLASGVVFRVCDFSLTDHVEKLFVGMAECVEKLSISDAHKPAATLDAGSTAATTNTANTSIESPQQTETVGETAGPAASTEPDTGKGTQKTSPTQQRPLIFYLGGFRDLVSTEVEAGRDILVFLNKAVNSRRQAGHPTIWIGGNCSSKTFYSGLGSGAGWVDDSQVLQVTPPGSSLQRAVLAADMPRWNMQSNVRALKRAMRSGIGGHEAEALAEVLAEWNLRDKSKFRSLLASLESGIWSSEDVWAVAKGIRGRLPGTGPVTEEDIAQAVSTMERSREENNEHAPRYISPDDIPNVAETSSAGDEMGPEETIRNVIGPIDDENSYLQCVQDGLVKPGSCLPEWYQP